MVKLILMLLIGIVMSGSVKGQTSSNRLDQLMEERLEQYLLDKDRKIVTELEDLTDLVTIKSYDQLLAVLEFEYRRSNPCPEPNMSRLPSAIGLVESGMLAKLVQNSSQSTFVCLW